MPDLFNRPTITRPYRCPCGSNQFHIDAPKGPHGNQLRCAECGRGGFWLPKVLEQPTAKEQNP
jgi:hypothetical protein